MEAIYNPETWETTNDHEKFEAASKVFIESCEQQRDRFLEATKQRDLDKPHGDDYSERIDLGLGMLDYYVFNVHPEADKFYKPAGVEVPFSIPLQYPDGVRLPDYANVGETMTCSNSPICGQTHDNPAPITLNGRVDALLEDTINGGYYIIDWKRQPKDSPILTPTGWTTMGQLRVGDLVVGSNGKSTEVQGVFPKGEDVVWEIELDDNTIVESAGDHPYEVYHQFNGSKRRILTPEQMINAPSLYEFRIPRIKPVEFVDNSRDLTLHPYVLGSLLGDGSFADKSQLVFSSKTGETVKLLEQYLPADMWISKNSEFNYTWTIKGEPNIWRQQIKDLNMWGLKSKDKYIPQVYLRASLENRILLMQGLMDTDGDTDRYRFTTVSPQLQKDFYELALSLGSAAKMGKDSYGNLRVDFQPDQSIQVNQLQSKIDGKNRDFRYKHRRIVRITKTDRIKDMQCIKVAAADSLYTTNNYVLTHNSAAQLINDGEFLQLDDQITSYVAALSHVLGLDIKGFLYAEIRKDYPKPLEELTRTYRGRKLSTNVNQMTTPELALQTIQEKDPEGYNQGLYNEYLERIIANPPKFHQRFPVIQGEAKLKNVLKNVAMEAIEMTNPDVLLYPSPSKMNCMGCAYKAPCLGKYSDEDYQYTLQTLFGKKTRE